MLDTSVLWRKQGENEVDGLTVHGFEVEQLLDPDKEPVNLRKTVEARVRQRDSPTDTGRAKALTLLQGRCDLGGLQSVNLRGKVAKFVEQALLAADGGDRLDGLRP